MMMTMIPKKRQTETENNQADLNRQWSMTKKKLFSFFISVLCSSRADFCKKTFSFTYNLSFFDQEKNPKIKNKLYSTEVETTLQINCRIC